MKIKHYRAPDMRHALRQVREEQGPDAVILSSRRISGGVEVVAAVDYDEEASFEQGYGERTSASRAMHDSLRSDVDDCYETPGSTDAAIRAAQAIRDSMSRPAPRASAPARVPSPESRIPSSDSRLPTPDSRLSTHDSRLTNPRSVARSSDFDVPDVHSDVNEELRTLRRMLETQLATLAWNDLSRRSPIQTELLKQLTTLGLAHDLAGELAAQLPAKQDFSEAHRHALAMLARRIETVEERWVESGGVVAMIGATGVGKTTLIAKLAARWVLRHGPRDIALVSTDAVRIGAQEQIHTLGRLIGAPAYAVDGAGELPALLEQLSERRLVLVDTAGLSQRDPHLEEELSLLASAHRRIETTLVLNAAAQAGAIEETVHKFSAARPASCVLTKLDEATSLGGAISTLIRSQLPLMYVSDGQRVPEDLVPARAHQLIARAVELSRRAGATPDEDLLRRRFGAVAHALA